MAQAKRSGASPVKGPTGKPPNPGRSNDTPSAGSRTSVAAGRQTPANSNRTQMIIGIVAVSLIVIVIVVGLVLNKRQNASPVTDHPTSVSSTSSVTDGVITVVGTTPAAGKTAVTIDLYEDGMCPACQAFESQFGQQIMKEVDEGRLTVRYHFLNFLNNDSPSKDYSTRASAAFQCVGAVPVAQAPKGLFLNFHTRMFSSGVQPAENGSTDLSNAEIAAIAAKAGAPASALTCITSARNIAQAKATAVAGAATLTKLAPNGAWGTPSATKDGRLLNLNDSGWLSNELG